MLLNVFLGGKYVFIYWLALLVPGVGGSLVRRDLLGGKALVIPSS